jgi:hypothetical protein
MDVQKIGISDRIKQKIELLVSSFDRVKHENEMLLAQKNELERLLREKEQAYSELEERYSRLKFARAFQASSEDVHDAKIRVNRIVREIDRCIALLNR